MKIFGCPISRALFATALQAVQKEGTEDLPGLPFTNEKK